MRHHIFLLLSRHLYFNPRTPGGVRLPAIIVAIPTRSFQSTHPGWGATCRQQCRTSFGLLFQSTHPGWGATLLCHNDSDDAAISIHAPRVGCDISFPLLWLFLTKISIHAPRVGCDQSSFNSPVYHYEFQSTHPGWGATRLCNPSTYIPPISIHAPRVGCDADDGCISSDYANFNPRTPGGVRRWKHLPECHQAQFQSTHPGWGATCSFRRCPHNSQISIHAPRVGCDSLCTRVSERIQVFQSTHPGWGATRCR